MTLRDCLEALIAGEDLSREQARELMGTIMSGGATPVQIAGLLVALRAKGETVAEITGFAEAMRGHARRLELGVDGLVDTCGTGGDGAGTFNVSTAAALVAAAAGVPVAKHGNRSVSSASGSADVLEALGVRLTDDPAVLARCLARAGIAFLFAPAQHPAMKHAIGPRRQLGVRTVFNVLGPLTNPAGATRQLMGVYDARLVRPLAEVLGRLGAERAWVVHGAGGLDEISTLGPTVVAEWDGERVREFTLEPESLGIARADAAALAGGTPADNAALLRRLLMGEAGAARAIVELNAAAALVVGGRAAELQEGLALARAAIDTGAAMATLEALVQQSGGTAA